MKGELLKDLRFIDKPAIRVNQIEPYDIISNSTHSTQMVCYKVTPTHFWMRTTTKVRDGQYLRTPGGKSDIMLGVNSKEIVIFEGKFRSEFH